MSPNSTADAPTLSLRGVSKHYDDFDLGPIDLELEPGMVLAFVGPNGAGKTTTLHSTMGLVRPDNGVIEVCGRVNDTNRPDWKQDVGFVGEIQGHYQSWTVEQNLRFIERFYRNFDRVRAEALAKRFGLRLAKRVGELSRGGKAKLALVAALAHSPRLLLLDEPTAGLDPVVRAEVLDVLWEFLEDGERSILYSTHVLSDISRLADEIAFLRDGRVVRRDAKDALTDAWRRLSFRYAGELPALGTARRHRRSGDEHELVTPDGASSVAMLRELGAERIQEVRMTIDEIAVEILREGHHVASD